MEEISGEIREAVEQLAETASQFDGMSELDRALLTEVEEALRLTLLEITELGTKLYPLASELENSALN